MALFYICGDTSLEMIENAVCAALYSSYLHMTYYTSEKQVTISIERDTKIWYNQSEFVEKARLVYAGKT